MGNKISYGPHLFPGGPELYIRTGNGGTSQREAHQNIMHTLGSAFNNKNKNSIQSQISKRFDLDLDSPVELAFMNYGNMQLVYLATLGEKFQAAISINQPQTPLGGVGKEFSNLQRLVEIDPMFVVEPLAHFFLEETGHELYASTYVDNAMCVAVQNGQGIYDPLPQYHFERFSPGMSSKVNASIISLLVNYYDEKRNKGLSKTQISGDDFLLTRNFDKNDSSTVQANMRIIAARDFLEIPFNQYLDVLRQEFLFGTNRDDPAVLEGKLRVNTRSKLPMTTQEIEEGIELGLKLRAQGIN